MRFRDFDVVLSPWSHQAECYQAFCAWLKRDEEACQCSLPTGTGKSLIQRAIAYRLVSEGYRVVIAVSSDEILSQFMTGFVTESNLRPSASSNRKKDKYHAKSVLNIVTQAYLWHREVRNQIATDSALIWDESHHANSESGSSYSDIASVFAKAIFFSATNWNLSKVRGPEIYRYSLSRAWEDGILAKPELIRINALDDIGRNRGRGICYHARSYTIPYGMHAVGGESVFGERSEIEKHIRAFQQKRLDVLHAVGRLTEGFDPVELNWIASPFANGTPIGEMQRLGRLLRNDCQPKVCFYNSRNKASLDEALELAL